MTLSIEITGDSCRLTAALGSLEKVAEGSPELVRRFLGGIDGAAELVRVDLDGGFAARAGECRVVLEPSELFREFLGAAGAGEFDGL